MLVLRKQKVGPASAKKPRGHPAPAAIPKIESAILCSVCGFTVTTDHHRIKMQGRHEHRFMNPAGFLYHLGCFAEAVGCVTVGPASSEYPWFPGFLWRFALCGGCRTHLGWHFSDEEGTSFFGLILDRLRGGERH